MYAVEAQFLRAVPMRDRFVASVLVDVRDAPMLANDGLELEAAKVIDAMASDFERSALLVRTAVGALQVRRIARTNPFRLELFEDEAAAIAYLSGNGPPPGSVAARRSSLPPPPAGRNREAAKQIPRCRALGHFLHQFSQIRRRRVGMDQRRLCFKPQDQR